MATRHDGVLTHWKDDRGFGFITPRAGGEKVFVHVSAFANRERRPLGNEKVTYRLDSDAHGRARAVSVAFAGERVPDAPPGDGRIPALSVAVLFIGFVTALAALGKLSFAVPVSYVAASLVTFLFYAADKSAARKGRWRTSEFRLHAFGLAGGWPGAMLAQQFLRHKSRKFSFQAVFWVTVILNGFALHWLTTPAGRALQDQLDLVAKSLAAGLR